VVLVVDDPGGQKLLEGHGAEIGVPARLGMVRGRYPELFEFGQVSGAE
jgi:hypothetical protein